MHILHILLLAGVSYAAAASDSCTYRHPTYGVINLASLGYQNGQPRFRDVSPLAASSNMYSFNPCFSFSESACSNAAVCQLAKDRSYSQTIAKQDSSVWTVDSFLTPTLTYTSASKTVAITMVCSMGSDDTLEILSSSSSNYVQMQLRSRCACWNQCTTPTTSPTTVNTATARWWYSTQCMYHDSQQGTIDLSSVGRVSNGPAFEDIPSSYPNDYVWSYNPCYSFSEDQCDEVAGCQLDKSRGVSYAIGLQNTADWINMRSNGSQYPTIRYSAPGTNRRLSVRLMCDRSSSSHRLQVLGETAVGEYLMQLTSRCACWNECTDRPTPVDWNVWSIIGITAGVVIVLVLMMMTCLFCSKPKRRYRYMVLNEKTPFYTQAI